MSVKSIHASGSGRYCKSHKYVTTWRGNEAISHTRIILKTILCALDIISQVFSFFSSIDYVASYPSTLRTRNVSVTVLWEIFFFFFFFFFFFPFRLCTLFGGEGFFLPIYHIRPAGIKKNGKGGGGGGGKGEFFLAQ